jgi:hypothetical protein
MQSKIYDELNKSWKSTCKILLGEEMGELKEYDEWLRKSILNCGKRKSHVSGRDLMFATDDYCKSANFISLDEVKERSMDPLTINEIKDIDSIVDAISEKWEYTGNKVIGNSTNVEMSDAVIDSQFVYGSTDIKKSSHILYSYDVVNSRAFFGSESVWDGEFLIKPARAMNLKRCFDVYFVMDSSDLYCCSNAFGCHDMMFSLNQRNKKFLIGNVPLSKEKYISLKAKLVGEIRAELRKSKQFPFVFEMIPNSAPDKDTKVSIIQSEEEGDIRPIEKAFNSTFKVLFKKEPTKMSEYEGWLSKYVGQQTEVKSPFGYKTSLPPSRDIRCYSLLPEKRLVSEQESLQLGNLQLDTDSIESLDKIMKNLPKIGYFVCDFIGGHIVNAVKSSTDEDSSNIYKTYRSAGLEFTGIVYVSKNSKYVFGCSKLADSQFAINCYSSQGLNRCFEMDSCESSSDSYFSHNCEGLQDAMFCWNVKGERHAIGNAELPLEQYRKVKDSLISQMADEIFKNKGLKYDIFNIGCYKK